MSQTALKDERTEPRQDVLHRTRMTVNGEVRPATLVNISPRGLMARIADDCAPGDRISIELPGIGAWAAEVRWSLGGRIGCRLDRMIGLADYDHMLERVRRP